MTLKAVVTDPWMAEECLARRRALGLDRWDESWDGVWHMPPAPNPEHQRMEAGLLIPMKAVIEGDGRGQVFHEVNVADPQKGMRDFRIPDIAVLLAGGEAAVGPVAIMGAPDFILEIHSPGDETQEKLPWYAALGVRELLSIDRDTKALALYRLNTGRLEEVTAAPDMVDSQVLPLRFERVSEGGAVRVRVSHRDVPGRAWLV